MRHEGRREGDVPEGWDPIASEPSPSSAAAAIDEVQFLKGRLPPLEARLFELSRVKGWTWDEIARVEGGKPDTLRMRLTRTIAQGARRAGRKRVRSWNLRRARPITTDRPAIS